MASDSTSARGSCELMRLPVFVVSRVAAECSPFFRLLKSFERALGAARGRQVQRPLLIRSREEAVGLRAPDVGEWGPACSSFVPSWKRRVGRQLRCHVTHVEEEGNSEQCNNTQHTTHNTQHKVQPVVSSDFAFFGKILSNEWSRRFAQNRAQRS